MPLRDIYCGQIIDTEQDDKIAFVRSELGIETMYMTKEGRYYFVVGGDVGFMEQFGMRKWIIDHFENAGEMLDRVGDALPVCEKKDEAQEEMRHAGPKKPSKPSMAWYLIPILFSVIGGLLMYLAVRNRDSTMARNAIVVGVASLAVNIALTSFLYP